MPSFDCFQDALIKDPRRAGGCHSGIVDDSGFIYPEARHDLSGQSLFPCVFRIFGLNVFYEPWFLVHVPKRQDTASTRALARAGASLPPFALACSSAFRSSITGGIHRSCRVRGVLARAVHMGLGVEVGLS